MASPAAKEDATSAAFFDFDHTLLHGDAGVIFGRTLTEWLYAKGRHLDARERRRHVAATTAQIAGTVGKALAYRGLNSVGIVKRSRFIEKTYTFLQGLPAEEMRTRMELVWNEKLRDLVFPEMLDVLARHRKDGRRIVIVTTGMRELVEHSRAALGQDIDVIGVEMEVDDEGLWLGTVTGPLWGLHKADAVRAWAEKHGVSLATSYAYSDHYSDVPFLEIVGHPVAVNPSLRLRLHARRRGWRILNVLPPVGAPPE